MTETQPGGLEAGRAMKVEKGWREPPAPRPAAHAAPPRQLNALTLLKSLRRRWPKAAAFGVVVGALLAAAVWFFLPPLKPMAFTKLRIIPIDRTDTISAPESQIAQQTHKEIILSTSVIRKAIDAPDIKELPTIAELGNAVRYLQREITVDFPAGHEIIRIRLEGDRPEDLPTIVGAVQKAYVEELFGRAMAGRQAKLEQLQDQLTREEQRVRKLRQAGDDDIKAKTGGDPQKYALLMNAAMNEYSALGGDLSRAEGNEIGLKAELQNLLDRQKTPEKAEVSILALESALQADEDALEASRAVKEYQRRLEDAEKRFDPSAPAVADIRKKLEELQVRYDARKGKLRNAFLAQAQDKMDRDAREAVAIKQGEIKISGERVARMRDRKAELEKQLGPRLMGEKDNDLERAAGELSSLKRKITQAELEMKAKQGIEELEPPQVVIPNDQSRRVKVAGFAGIAGLACTMLFFAFLEFLARRVNGIDDVIMDMGMRLVGSIPKVPSKPLIERGLTASPSAADLHWNTLLTESVDSARTILLHSARAMELKTLLIGSAVAGEGKSTASRNLALSFARSGRRTLLIDGDLRKPTVHDFFGIPMTPGVCEALRGEVEPLDAVVAGNALNLFILAAGKVDRLGIQQLAQEGFGRILAELRGQFDFIVIDSSPILPVADGMLMARHADGVLFSLFVGVSQVERVNSAYQRLHQLDVPIVGALVSGTREELYGYGAKYYQGIKG